MPEPKPDFKPITRKSADASQLPAGHARDEQIKVNADANAQRIEQASDTAGAINPAAFAPDREILAYTAGDFVLFGFGHVAADDLPTLDFGLVDPVADVGFGVVKEFPRVDEAGLAVGDFKAVGVGQDFAVGSEGGRVDGDRRASCRERVYVLV